MTSLTVEVAPPLPHQRHGGIAPLVLADDIVLLRGTASPEFTVTSYAALNSRQFRVTEEGRYRVLLSSDNSRFGGFNRPDETFAYETYEHQLSLYVPSRVALVLARAQ